MKLIKTLAGVIFLLVILNITVANYSLDDSVVVSNLSQEINSLKHANVILRAEVASKGSLTLAVNAIESQGYASPEKITALASPESLALR